MGYLSALTPPALFGASVLCGPADVTGETCNPAGDFLFSYIFFLMVTFLPVLVIVWLALHFEWRQLFPYATAGGILGLLVALPMTKSESALMLFILSGLFGVVSGSIYWFIAARRP